MDDFLCFVILLFACLQLLRKERLKDVECEGEGLDGRRAGTHYHTPGERASLDREIVNNSRGHHMLITTHSIQSRMKAQNGPKVTWM